MAVTPNHIASEDSGSVSLTTSFQEIVAGNASGSFVMLSVSSPNIAQCTLTIGNESVDSGTASENTLCTIIIPSNAGNSSSAQILGPIHVTQSGLIAGVYYDAYGNLGILLSDATKKIKAKSSVAGLFIHYSSLNFGGTSARFYATMVNSKATLSGSYADIVAGGASGSFVDSIYLVSNTATDRIVRFADENGRLLGSVVVPGNAGNSVSVIPLQVNVLPYLCRLEYDGYGNQGIRLKNSTKKIQALQTAGSGDVFLYYTIKHY